MSENYIEKKLEELTKQVQKLEQTMYKTMGEMCASLKEHTKFSNLAHERLDKHDKKMIEMKYELEKVDKDQNKMIPKLDLVCGYVDEERKYKEFKRKLEEEKERKRDRLARFIRNTAIILGSPMALYGLYEGFLIMFSKIFGGN